MSFDLVDFKSVPFNYDKEKDGRKPNTLRRFSVIDDPRRNLLERWADLDLSPLSQHIRITNTETGESFERSITDVTYWDGWFIISWKHEED